MIALLLGNWKLIALAALIAALGVQSYRLQGAQGEIRVFEEREAAQKRDQAKRELANLRNKERTDEEYLAARRRAAIHVVRAKPTTIVARREAPPARSDQRAAECVRRGDIDLAVDHFAIEHAARLGDVISEVSRRHAAEATNIARELEILGAAYRACHAYAVNVE